VIRSLFQQFVPRKRDVETRGIGRETGKERVEQAPRRGRHSRKSAEFTHVSVIEGSLCRLLLPLHCGEAFIERCIEGKGFHGVTFEGLCERVAPACLLPCRVAPFVGFARVTPALRSGYARLWPMAAQRHRDGSMAADRRISRDKEKRPRTSSRGRLVVWLTASRRRSSQPMPALQRGVDAGRIDGEACVDRIEHPAGRIRAARKRPESGSAGIGVLARRATVFGGSGHDGSGEEERDHGIHLSGFGGDRAASADWLPGNAGTFGDSRRLHSLLRGGYRRNCPATGPVAAVGASHPRKKDPPAKAGVPSGRDTRSGQLAGERCGTGAWAWACGVPCLEDRGPSRSFSNARVNW
jgi:hypothetical protein